MIKFLSIEERISECQPASQKENNSKSAVKECLKTKIPELAEEIRDDNRNMRNENRELRNEYR